MNELLFILVTVYVAYVVYTTVNDKPVGGGSTDSSAAEVESASNSEAPVEAPKTPEKTPAGPIIAAVAAKSSDELKNPKTGEISKIPNNYRFGKRWIKDALVAEGLLDKVYKNNELDDATNDKAQAALMILKKMEKYQV